MTSSEPQNLPEAAETKHVNISINTGALLGSYLADIQNLLDIVTFVYAGQGHVTEELYQNPLGFMSFHPASNQRLSYAEARERSSQWLLTSFLANSIDTSGNFLDECRKICALYRLGGKGKAAGQELQDIFDKDWKRFHRLGFPDKFDHLRDEFGVQTEYEKHFLSLNQARNCLVHRKGVVGSRDTNEDGKLMVTWRVMVLVAKAPDKDEEIVIDSPTQVEAGWSVQIKAIDKQRAFQVGQRIELTVTELYQNISTLFALGSTFVKSIEAYGATQRADKAGS